MGSLRFILQLLQLFQQSVVAAHGKAKCRGNAVHHVLCGQYTQVQCLFRDSPGSRNQLTDDPDDIHFLCSDTLRLQFIRKTAQVRGKQTEFFPVQDSIEIDLIR